EMDAGWFTSLDRGRTGRQSCPRSFSQTGYINANVLPRRLSATAEPGDEVGDQQEGAGRHQPAGEVVEGRTSLCIQPARFAGGADGTGFGNVAETEGEDRGEEAGCTEADCHHP